MRGPQNSARLQDTSQDVEKVLVELTRQAPSWKRAQQLSDMILAQHVLILADLRRRYPNCTADELRKRMAARLLPKEDVIRMFNWDPEKQGY